MADASKGEMSERGGQLNALDWFVDVLAKGQMGYSGGELSDVLGTGEQMRGIEMKVILPVRCES